MPCPKRLCPFSYARLYSRGLDDSGGSATAQIRNLERVHMRTIAVTINKGGGGKTTLTKSLATAATATVLNVLILGTDTQENSASWGQRRNKQPKRPLPVARFTTERGLTQELSRAGKAGCDLVFIDTPARA